MNLVAKTGSLFRKNVNLVQLSNNIFHVLAYMEVEQWKEEANYKSMEVEHSYG